MCKQDVYASFFLEKVQRILLPSTMHCLVRTFTHVKKISSWITVYIYTLFCVCSALENICYCSFACPHIRVLCVGYAYIPNALLEFFLAVKVNGKES